jgi:hypothetical protein
MSFLQTFFSAIGRALHLKRHRSVEPSPNSERLICHYVDLVDAYGSESPAARQFREEHRADAHLVWLMSRLDSIRARRIRRAKRSSLPN